MHILGLGLGPNSLQASSAANGSVSHVTFRPNRSGQLCDALRRLPVPREPEWEDFIDAEGRLLPIEHLRSESPEERAARREKVDRVLAKRRKAYQAVASSGLPTGGLPPQGIPSPNSRPPTSPSDTQLEQKIREVEAAIAEKPVEHGIVIDDNGNVVLSKVGTVNQVPFTVDEVLRMDGKILIHNHPQQQGIEITFSGADVNMLLTARLKQIRAVTAHWSHFMENQGSLPDSLTARSELGDAIEREYNTTVRKRLKPFCRKLLAMVNKGQISRKEADQRYAAIQEDLRHQVWTEIAPKHQLVYRREKR